MRLHTDLVVPEDRQLHDPGELLVQAGVDMLHRLKVTTCVLDLSRGLFQKHAKRNVRLGS